MSHRAIPDGVYVGFTGSGFHGDPFSHAFITIVRDGREQTIEYGNSPDGRLIAQGYGDKLETADFAYSHINPPPGVTEKQFEQRILDAAKRYDTLAPSEQLRYDALNGANCENMASGLLKEAGVSQDEIEQIPWAHTLTSFDPHFSKPLDLKAFFNSLPVRTPLPTHTIAAPDGSQAHQSNADGQASRSTRDTTTHHQSTGAPGAAHATESRAASQPTSSAPVKPTEMTGEQIRLYVDIRKDAREVFAQVLGESPPTVSVERNGATFDRDRFADSSGRIVGLEDGKLIQQSARGQITSYDYGDLLVNAKDPVAFDAMARRAIETGEQMNLSMQNGQVAMMQQQRFAQQQTVQLGVADLGLAR